MRKHCLGVVLTCLLGFSPFAYSASLEAPAEAVIGTTVDVKWEASGNNYDSIYIVAPDAADDAKGINSSSVLNGKNPIGLVMPEFPGEYELRYWSNTDKRIEARGTITVVDTETSLDAPDNSVIGNAIEVKWQGPGNRYDQIALYSQGAADDSKADLSQGITSATKPIIIHLPEQPGEYELRYLTRQQGRILARRPITVTDATASLDAPGQADIGATIAVNWEGPGNQYDKIAVHAAAAADDAKPVRSQGIVSRRNPISIRLPETAGNYELRYQTAKTDRILARRPLIIGSVAASLDAPETATADTPILVNWEGPGNNYDQIALYPAAAADDAKAITGGTILSGKNPVTINLPDTEGEYQLRYVTTQSGAILARRDLKIQPAGRLAVIFERSNQSEQQGSAAVELILDASGSMLQRENGVRRIEIARQVLDELVREHLSDDRQFALRVFGHKEADKCRTDLEIPLGPLDRAAAAEKIAGVNAMNLAKTPIADSLAQVPSDLAGASGPKTIILITDGEETCDGDPAAVIAKLRDQGLDVQVSIIGFAIDDADLKNDFETWASLGGGSYFDARSADELIQSLRTVISGPFRVFNAAGEVVGQGVIGGAEIVLPAGIYRVETIAKQPLVIEAVEIKPRELTEAAF